ncbi:hypothetical protein UJ101_02517 [Flavobacteriaceae bacterium UJ101]|nr:hypothetical protein UJ101_02517 [Flavobacteriaceae bacterium UJ101]
MKTSKLLRTLCLVLFFQQAFAQVGIEKASVDGDGILDFPENTTKGIILPRVSSISGAVNGTLIFDTSDNKVKVNNGTDWEELTTDTGAARVYENTVREVATNQGVILGSDTSSAPGVLVLESTDKALILPKIVEPHKNVVNPEPGMICYDVTNNTLSIFNGKTWEFWK